MAKVLGTAISVSLETDVAKNGGGTYKGWELVYKANTGEVRTIAKPVQGLTFNPALKGQLQVLQAGEKFTLEQEKEGAFLVVKSVVKGWDDGAVQAPSVPPKGQGQTNTYQARDYESKEERTARQRLIVRQSSLTAALSTLTPGAKTVDKEAVKALAEEYFDWVFESGETGIQNMEDDIPY